jgi:hypothetical protein
MELWGTVGNRGTGGYVCGTWEREEGKGDGFDPTKSVLLRDNEVKGVGGRRQGIADAGSAIREGSVAPTPTANPHPKPHLSTPHPLPPSSNATCLHHPTNPPTAIKKNLNNCKQ